MPELYARHRGQFKVSEWQGRPEVLTPAERETIDAVCDDYGKMTSQWLSDLTHMEAPWRDAREGLDGTDFGTALTAEVLGRDSPEALAFVDWFQRLFG